MTRDTVLEYLKTIFLTMLFAFVLVLVLLGVIQHQVYKEENAKPQDDDAIDYQLIGIMIDKNLFLETQYPKDYKFNYKLGILYEMENNLKQAEEEFKLAIEKVPFGEYKPYYRLALFYLRLNRLDEAEALMNSIDEQPDKRLITFKADIFNKLGDKYYNLGDYETAALKYQKSLLYYNAIKSDKTQQVENSLASAYVYQADQYVNAMQIEDAINSLQMALGIIDAPILKYRLALLLMNSDPNRAYQYFEEVYKREPGIINYGTYTAFLFTLSNDAQAKGDFSQAKLYDYKIRTLKEYSRTNILSVEDLKLDSVLGKIKVNHWTKKYSAQIELQVKNVSRRNIDSLYLEVVFKDKGEVIDDYFQQIVDSKSVLKPKSESPLVVIKTEKIKANEDKKPKEITAEIYVMKTQDSYKILLQTVDIKQTKTHYKNKFKKMLDDIFHKLALILPAWMY